VNINVRFEVLTEVKISMLVFRVVTLFILVDRYTNVSQKHTVSFFKVEGLKPRKSSHGITTESCNTVNEYENHGY
jgi:hypothetical protein